MIKYQMRCSDGHLSEIWFRDSASCDEQVAARRVSCPVCGGDEMTKALMAPRVAKKARPDAAPVEAAQASVQAGPAAPAPRPDAPQRAMALTAEAVRREIEGRLRALRAQVEASSENVGDRFAEEARAIHAGESESRAIYGQCSIEDAEDLVEEGVPVTPLPWIDRTDD
jgi:hypothetical protein